MEHKVVFYQLTHKFLNQDQAIPEGPRQVIYYSLAIGHHVGVMDCFQPLMELPLEAFESWLGCLPDGPGRKKLDGLMKFGEIEINHDHAHDISDAINACMGSISPQQAGWSRVLLDTLT